MKPLQLFCIICFILLFSCEFEPSGVYEVEVEQIIDAPIIEIDLNVVSDTIFIPSRGDVRFTYKTNDQEVTFVSLIFNNKEIMDYGPNGGFNLRYESNLHQKNTPYPLILRLFRKSGTGSLADEMMQEGFVYEVPFTLIFLDNDEFTPQITKVYPDAGSMKIEWEKFRGIGFKAYHVYNTEFHKVDVITDQNITGIYDPTYIGYGGTYFIVTQCENDSYKSKVVSKSSALPVAWATKTDKGNFLVKWHKTKFENNVLAYRVYEYYNRFDHLQEIAYITDLSDTSLIYDNARFAIKNRFYVEMVAKESFRPEGYWQEDFRYYTTSTEDYFMGNEIPIISYRFFNNPLGRYCYYGNYEWLFKYESEQGMIVDSMKQPRADFSVSPDGTKILGVNSQTSLALYNSDDFSVIKSINFDKMPGKEMPYRTALSDSDIGVIVQNGYYFYDFNKETILSGFVNEGQTNHEDPMKISSDGQFFCASHYAGNNSYNAELYQLKDSFTEQIWKEDNVMYFDFDAANNHFVYFKNHKLRIVALPDFTVVNEIETEDSFVYSLDWNNREFLSLNSEHDLFSIRDVETGTVKKQVRTYGFDSYGSDYQYIFLSNKTLFTSQWPKGLSLQLEY